MIQGDQVLVRIIYSHRYNIKHFHLAILVTAGFFFSFLKRMNP